MPGIDRKKALKIGAWVAQPDRNLISRGENQVRLGSRIMDLLLALAERRDEVVSRQELMRIVWHDAIVSEETLNVAISDLRRALGDDLKNPEYIETIRKGGYILIADVTESGEPIDETKAGADCDAVTKPEAVQSVNRDSRSWSRRKRLYVIAMALSALIILLVRVAPLEKLLRSIGIRGESNQAGQTALFSANSANHSGSGPTRTEMTAIKSSPLTSYPSSEITPALSHDGTRVAFAWAGPDMADLDIYMKQTHHDPPIRLTDHPGYESFPAWSPDNATIAFCRAGREGGVFTVPAIGGPARRLIQVHSSIIGLDWALDGSALYYSCLDSTRQAFEIVRLPLETLEPESILMNGRPPGSALYPAISPDSRTLAFVLLDYCGLHDIWLLDVLSGDTRRLTHGQRLIEGLDWTSDGRGIVFPAAPTGVNGLWFAAKEDGALTWLPTRGDIIQYPTIAQRDGRLAYEKQAYNFDVWQVQFDPAAIDSNTEANSPEPPGALISSSYQDSESCFSSDGRQIVFISTRTGNREIWVCQSDGSNPLQASNLSGIYASRPQWSPMGRWIGFLGIENGLSGVYVLDTETAIARRLRDSDQQEIFTGWSNDGDWLYYTVMSPNNARSWKTNFRNGNSVQVSENDGMCLGEIENGRTLLCLRSSDHSIWRQSIDGDGQKCLVPGETVATWAHYIMVDKGAYLARNTQEKTMIWFYNYETEKETLLTTIPKLGLTRLALSPDCRRLLFDYTETFTCDLMLVEGFR